jgi:hypothetical protein
MANGEWLSPLTPSAGDKSGGREKRFYRELIRKADERLDAHLARLKKERK